MGGFAALFILRRESQTALPKIALSVGFCLAVRVALSDRVADNGLQLPEGGDFTHQLSFGELSLKYTQNCPTKNVTATFG